MLIVAQSQARISMPDAEKILSKIKLLPIKVDITSPKGMAKILEIAMAHHLSAYDASYLELSLRKDIPLATLDKQLLKAAKKAGVMSVEP